MWVEYVYVGYFVAELRSCKTLVGRKVAYLSDTLLHIKELVRVFIVNVHCRLYMYLRKIAQESLHTHQPFLGRK